MWTPVEIRKIIGLVFGLGFIAWGAKMMIDNIMATGKVEIQASIMSGKLETGSAGMFLAVIGLFVVAFSMLNFDKREGKTDFLKNNKVILAICILLFFIVTMILYVSFPNGSTLIVFACSSLIFPFVVLVRAIVNE